MKRLIATLLAVFFMAGTAHADTLRVVATSPSLGALARTVGAERVEVTVLAAPDRDLHALQAKPTMIRSLRDADLLLAVGADLEVGWLPVAITSAANPDIAPGKPGYFEAAAQVALLDVGGHADRALGHVHPVGNPHINMDPVRMVDLAAALADRLGSLDPGGASNYRSNAETFATAVEERMGDWHDRLQNAPGAVLYHRDAVYLFDRFGVPLLGTIEEIPGVPASARRIKALSDSLDGRDGVIIRAPYNPAQAPNRLATALGWDVKVLTLEPPMTSDGLGYLAHLEQWVLALAPAR
jgi:zinc/manganese transport system substrate-binding protein